MKSILVLLFFLPVILIGQKQYAPLNATWNYEGHEIDCLGNHQQFVVEREVMIGDKNCSIIQAYIASDVNPDFIRTNDSLVVWEDSNRVYFLEDSSFYLLYDFEMEVGDTVEYYDPINRGLFSSSENIDPTQGPNELRFVVTGIEEKNISGELRKHFSTENIFEDDLFSCQEIIIENIGSTSQGITGDVCFYVAEGCFGGLNCYSNDQIEYLTSDFIVTPNPACDPIDSNENLAELKSILIAPNPASDYIEIKTTLEIVAVDLLTIQGKKIRTYGSDRLLDVSDVPSGLYFLLIAGKDFKTSVKLVKD